MTFKVLVDHIHLRSADPDQAALFYVEALKGSEKSRIEVGNGLRVVVDLGSVALFIEQAPAGAAASPEAPFLGLEHLALRVDDLNSAVADLRRRNVQFVSEPLEMRPGVRATFIKGPDNVLVELIERK